MTSPASSPLRLHGVDHTARPTWRLRETVHFYRDILGLPLVHVISARGWGPATHPDFLHFFFDSGRGSTIAASPGSSRWIAMPLGTSSVSPGRNTVVVSMQARRSRPAEPGVA